MTRLGVADHPGFKVDALEVERPGTTYTVDTLRELHERYPASELVFITGADAARTLPVWHRAEELAKLARFAVVARNGEALSESELHELARAGFTVEAVDNVNTGDVSSHRIRRLVQEGESISALVPENVERYIIEKNLYR